MNSDSEKTINGLPRRPQIADASTAAVLGGISLGFLKNDWIYAGGAVLANQKQPLEFAVREYFKQKDLEVAFFYRAPRAVKVTFSYAPDAYWTVESVMPDQHTYISDEDRDDWLYGNLIENELPKVLRKIKKRKSK